MSFRPAQAVSISAVLFLTIAASAESWNTTTASVLFPTLNTTKLAVGLTSAPAYKTELRGHPTGNLWQALKLSTAGASHVTLSAAPGTNSYFVLNSNGGSNGIILSTGSPDGNSGLGTERMRILSSGNVGIGTTSASNRLDVEGGMAVGAAYSGSNAAPTNGLIVEGRVGIGVNSVNGESNLAIGSNGANEGGQIQLNAPTASAGKAVHLDSYLANGNQPIMRFLAGTNSSSQTHLASLDLTNGDFGVTGQLSAKSIRINSSWTLEVPDYVFEEGYRVTSLEETEKFVKKNKHLPEIPSAKQLNKEGMDLAEMNLRLLKKVEELTLHAIAQEKRLRKLETRADRR